MPVDQATIPEHFNNLWLVGGSVDEHEHAQKRCRVLGWERDEGGADLIRVAFLDRADLFDAEEALIHPHMLFPA